MQELINIDSINIEDIIYEVKGKQVMLASDIAKLYHVETKVLNQVVKRNIERFPSEFCFQLTITEIDLLSLRSQFVTLNKNDNLRGQHYKYLPYVFTEQGVAMLSALLKSDVAIKMSIKIMDAFVTMRRYISKEILNTHAIEYKLLDHDERIKVLENTFSSFKEQKDYIFYEGQIYDAYSVVIDIFNKAKKEIIIIDNYLDKNMLDIISKAKVKVTLITANKLDNLDLVKYNKQYSNLNVIIDNRFHDRFIVLDKELFYHLGSSLNSIGKKCFAIVKFEETETINKLISIINSI